MRSSLFRASWLLAVAATATGAEPAHEFLAGADFSHVALFESRGKVYRDRGQPDDPFQILRRHGLNCVRLRLFTSSAGQAQQRPYDAINNLDYTVPLAVRVKKAGLRFLLDFHYSDSWADPGKQTKPAAWKDLAFEQLEQRMFEYNRDCLAAFRRAGAPPDYVQVGNEITPGLLWPDGRVGGKDDTPEQWAKLGRLIKAAIRGIKESAGTPPPKIMIHLDRGGNWAATKWFFDHLREQQVEFDIIGQSYYPFWHGTLDDLRNCLTNAAQRYGKPIIVAETGFPWIEKDRNGNPLKPLVGINPGREGQVKFVEELAKVVKGVPGGQGLGVFWWGAEFQPVPGLNLAGFDGRSFFDHDGNTLPVVAALGRLTRPSSDNWPRWRGPHDNGSTEGGAYPVKWDATTNLLWKAPLPGKGCSTPIVWNQRIFLTAPVEGQDALLAFDWSGKPLWQTALGPERPGKNRNGSGSNPSPATDGRSVFVYFKSGSLAAMDLDGKLRWKANLLERFGKDTLYWDYGTSPVPTEKDVVVAMMHHGESWLAAFDKLTGELRWKVARNYSTPVEGDHSYATPILIRHQGQEALLVWGAQHLTAHAAADGKVLWSCGDFNPESKNNWVAVASPVLAGDVAVVPYGRGTRLHGIRLGGSGDVPATHWLWKREDTGSFVPTPSEYGGRIYLLRDRGEVECLDPATGRTLWSGALPKHGASYYASPTVADGKLYAAREDGVVFVARVEGRFEVLAENNLGDRLIASPVPVSNRLLLRGEKHMFCVGAE